MREHIRTSLVEYLTMLLLSRQCSVSRGWLMNVEQLMQSGLARATEVFAETPPHYHVVPCKSHTTWSVKRELCYEKDFKLSPLMLWSLSSSVDVQKWQMRSFPQEPPIHNKKVQVTLMPKG
jgi:hypothetical protein